MQRKTRYTRTYQVSELSAHMPKLIFSQHYNVVLCQLFFKTDAVKILPQHYQLYIYFLFTVNSQFDNHNFLFAAQIRRSINCILFFFPSFALTPCYHSFNQLFMFKFRSSSRSSYTIKNFFS